MLDSVIVGTRWDAQVSLNESHQDIDPAGLTGERVLEEIAETLFVEGPLKGRLCLELTVAVVKRGSRIAAGSQISVTGIVRAVSIEQDNDSPGELIRIGIAVRSAPGAKEALMTGTLEVQCRESVQVGIGSQSWQVSYG